MNESRLYEIDGIRGWAALCVVLFHEFQETFGIIHPEIMRADTRLFMDGTLAVYIFFILSGDALSTAFIAKGDVQILDRVEAKRYFRLCIPVLFFVIPTFIIMKLGLIFNHEASKFVHREAWSGTFLQFDPGIYDAIRYSFAGVFGWAYSPNAWNTFLWTMPVELVGSILTFLYLHLYHRLRYKGFTTLVVICIFSICSDYYGLFFCGIILAHFRSVGVLSRIRKSLVGVFLGPLFLTFAYVAEWKYYSVPWPDISRTDMLAVIETYFRVHEKPILAVVIVCGIYFSSPLVALFGARLSRMLGRLSFGMYLAQFPVLCSFESYLIMSNSGSLNSLTFVVLVALASIAMTFLVAEVFARADTYVQHKIGKTIGFLFERRGDPRSESRGSGNSELTEAKL